MKKNLTILFILITCISFSQTDIKKEIEKLPFGYLPACDTINKKLGSNVICELKLKIDIQNAWCNNNNIKIVGFVKSQPENEPLQHCQIWVGFFKGNFCNLINYLGETDSNGQFIIEFKNEKSLSLYFWYFSYKSYEIEIGNLMK